MDSQYMESVCTVLASGIDYLWRHRVAYIQEPYPVWSNEKREGCHQDSGGAKQGYGITG